MPAIKRSKVWTILLIVIVVLLGIIFKFNYDKVNDPQTKFRIKEQAINYNEALEDDNLIVTIKKPIRKKVYDRDYQEYVYRYKIPFEATNAFGEDEEMFRVSKVQLVSAGRAWYGWPDDAVDEDGNRGQKNWDFLKAGETMKGTWSIDVIIDEDDGLPEEVYEDYNVYYIDFEGDTCFKYRYE